MYIWFLGWSGHGAFCSAQMVLKPIWTKSGAKTLVSKYLYYVLNQGISKVYRIFPCCNALIFMYSHLNGYLFHLQWNEFIFERSWMSNFTMGTILGKGFAQAQVLWCMHECLCKTLSQDCPHGEVAFSNSDINKKNER